MSLLQPTLKGNLVFLRPLETEDFDSLLSAASDPLVWEQHPQPDRYKVEVFKTFFSEAMSSRGAVAIFDQKTKKIIGCSRFYDHSTDGSSVVVGYTFLTREFWGGAYNWDLKKLMVNHALNFVKTVFFHVGVSNLRSQRAMIKIGAVNTGVQEIAVSYAPPKKSYVYRIDKKLG
jgi:RimJ/RimL family protein N-acetyltransferase